MNYQSMDDKIFSRIWTDNETVKTHTYLTDECNGRFACSADERKAGDYMLAKFKEYGLENVHAESFQMKGWVRGEASMVADFGDGTLELDCWEMACNPGGDCEGVLVDIGDGTEEQIEEMADQLKGKVAFTNTKGPHRSAKYGACQKVGAVGLVIFNGTPGSLKPAGSISLGDMELKMPAVGVSLEVGSSLQRKLKAGQTITVKISTSGHNAMMEARNIIAEIPGTDPEAGWIIVGGHYDGHDVAQAAFDNGSGTVLTLEVGRVLNQFKGELKVGVRCILFSGEELGLYGSFNYVKDHADEMETIRAVFNADCVGQEMPMVLMTQEAPEFAALLNKYADKGMDIVVNDKTYVPHSDHFPFALKGLPTLMAVTSRPPTPFHWVHTTADTLDKINFNNLRMTTATAARIIGRMATNPDDLPKERFDDAQVREFIVKHGHEKAMIAQGVIE